MMANISSSSNNATASSIATSSSNSSNTATTTDDNNNNSNNNNSAKEQQQQQQQQEYYNTIATKLSEGIEIKDRKWYAKTYRQCFLHSEAVQYIKSHYYKDEVKAVELLNQLQYYGYLQHVVDPNKKFKVGQKQKLYFRLFVQQKVKGTKKMINNNNNNNKKDEKKEEVNHNNNNEQQQQKQLSSLQQEGKWNRISSSVTQLTDTQRTIETKLEIVHQCVISIIQTMVSIALLLLVLLIYTLFVIVPTLRRDIESSQQRQPQQNSHNETSNTNNIFLGTATIVIFLFGAIAFIIQGRNLFSIWLALDTSVIQATEGKDAVEDYEMRMSDNNNNNNNNISKPASATTSTTATTTTAAASTPRRRQSSIILKEPTMMREMSSQLLLRQRGSSSSSSSILQQRQSSDIPDPSTWPHRPILVCVNTPVSSSLTIEPTYNNNGPCPIGIPFHFSSDLFIGQCLIRIKNVPNSNNSIGDKLYFDGRRRIFQTIIQGRFKESLRVSDVVTGHEFIRPLENLPHPWIIKAATNVIGKLAPGATIQVMGKTPTMLASLAATSQIVRGDEPGNEPNIAACCSNTTKNDEDNINNEDNDIQEDCSMLGGKFATTKVSSMGRKLHLANPDRAAQYTYDTETIYTFDFYQSLLNVGTYSLDMGIANIHIAPILNGQPIQCLCKTIDGRYLWSFQIWHENLLPSSSSGSGSSSCDDEKDKKRKTC